MQADKVFNKFAENFRFPILMFSFLRWRLHLTPNLDLDYILQIIIFNVDALFFAPVVAE